MQLEKMRKVNNLNIMVRNSWLFFLIFGYGHLFAQDVGRQQLVDNYAVDYLRIAGNQSALFYGNLQEGHPRTMNHPYLKDIQYAKARLSYLRIIYPEVLLRLDLSRNELIIQTPDFRNLVLFPENIDFAEFHGRHIIYFRRDSLPGCPSSGYYTLLHSGKCKVLEKQAAKIMVDNTHQYYYDFSTNFYLYHNGVYYTIRNKSGLLKVLQPYKKELKRFISSHHWQFRNDAEKLISQTVNEYEKLSGVQ